MPRTVTCRCGRRLSVHENQAGRSIICPACDERVHIPKDPNRPAYLDDDPGSYELQEEKKEDTLQSVVRKRAKRLKAAAKHGVDDYVSPWVRLVRKAGLRPWWGNQYRIKIAAGETVVVTAEGLRNLLIKGELTPESEVAWYDPMKPLAPPDWQTIEQGPGKTEFCIKVFFDPVGAYVREGAKRGAIYGPIVLWVLFVVAMFIGISAENGLRGGMVFLGIMSFIALIVAFEAWIFLNADPIIVLCVLIFIGFWPIGILLIVSISQVSFMVICGAAGALLGLIIGSANKASVPSLPVPDDRPRRRRKPRRYRDD